MYTANHFVTTALAALLSAFALALSSTAAAGDLEEVGNFALIDHQGGFLKLDEATHKQALVILSQANSCASLDSEVAKLRQLRDQWQDKDVAFYLMNSVAHEDRSDLIKAAQKQSLDFPILDDSAQLIAEKLGIDKAGQAVVLDPETMSIAYRGPVGSQLGKTLDAIMTGKPQATTVVETKTGCDLSFPVLAQHNKQAPDYATEVAPIIEEKCAHCHREGGIGPFAMDNYLMVKGFSPMIREVLLTKRMPPMQVDPHFNHFTNANYMSDDQLQTLVHWVDAGAPRGDSETDPLTDIEQVDMRAWQLGEPDYIVRAPKHDVPATGVLDYINTTVELDLEEDKWVKAVQFIPGDPAVLHHLLSYVVQPTQGFIPGQEVRENQQEQSNNSDDAEEPRQRRRGNVARGLNARKFLEGYAPGKVDAMTFPEDTGVFIPKGHKLSMQFHYTTNGKATSDETLLGLYFHDKDNPPKREYLNTAVATMFEIPPYAVEHKTSASHVFEDDIILYGMRPHMHYRGKYMKFTATYPDGRTETLLNVPDYSYNWQPTFQLAEPIVLPAGTEVTVSGAFDNSEHNPFNPDPSKTLTFGLQSWDEMFIGYFSYSKLDPEAKSKPDG